MIKIGRDFFVDILLHHQEKDDCKGKKQTLLQLRSDFNVITIYSILYISVTIHLSVY